MGRVCLNLKSTARRSAPGPRGNYRKFSRCHKHCERTRTSSSTLGRGTAGRINGPKECAVRHNHWHRERRDTLAAYDLRIEGSNDHRLVEMPAQGTIIFIMRARPRPARFLAIVRASVVMSAVRHRMARFGCLPSDHRMRMRMSKNAQHRIERQQGDRCSGGQKSQARMHGGNWPKVEVRSLLLALSLLSMQLNCIFAVGRGREN
jgi:hypothetical protein